MSARDEAAKTARRNADRTTFLTLPPVARVYVAAISLLGTMALAASAAAVNPDQLLVLAGLMVLTLAASSIKIVLPLGRGASNLSLAHTINFLSLFLVGAPPTVCVAALSAAVQCTFRTNGSNPPHRVIFSIASLVLTVWLSALPLSWALGADRTGVASLLRAVAIVAPLYFAINTGLVAVAVAL